MPMPKQFTPLPQDEFAARIIEDFSHILEREGLDTALQVIGEEEKMLLEVKLGSAVRMRLSEYMVRLVA